MLGELLAGVLLGSSVAGLVDPKTEVIHLLAELGVVILLFGGRKLPELAKGLGQGLKEFKSAVKESPAAEEEKAQEA